MGVESVEDLAEMAADHALLAEAGIAGKLLLERRLQRALEETSASDGPGAAVPSTESQHSGPDPTGGDATAASGADPRVRVVAGKRGLRASA